MKKSTVALVRYEKPGESVRKAVNLSKGLDRMSEGAKVFIKPNIVFWTRLVAFPKYGVITTSRVVEDMVVLLKERGIMAGAITLFTRHVKQARISEMSLLLKASMKI